MQRMGIYIHIPFCVRKCRYCDFLSFPAAEREKDRYVQALLEEIRREAERYQDAVVDSVFIGGGTPTVLAEGALEGILACLRASFHFADEAGAEDLRIAENDGDEPGEGKPFGIGDRSPAGGNYGGNQSGNGRPGTAGTSASGRREPA